MFKKVIFNRLFDFVGIFIISVFFVSASAFAVEGYGEDDEGDSAEVGITSIGSPSQISAGSGGESTGSSEGDGGDSGDQSNSSGGGSSGDPNDQSVSSIGGSGDQSTGSIGGSGEQGTGSIGGFGNKSVASSRGDAGGRAAEMNYEKGKKLFYENVVCDDCPYADLVLETKEVKSVWPDLKKDIKRKGEIGKDLRFSQRMALLDFVRKRFAL